MKISWPLIAGVLLALNVAAQAAPHAHEHGAVRVDIALDGTLLSIAIEAPQDSLFGFERAPRNDAERRAATAALDRLRRGGDLFIADAAAQCRLDKAEVEALPWPADAKAAPQSEHADVDARYEYRCAQPQQLRSLESRLFEAFARIQRVDVQVAGPQGQIKSTLKRPARTIRLVR